MKIESYEIEGSQAQRRPRSNFPIFMTVFLVLQCFTVNALAYSVCNRNCAPTDVACHAAIAACETRMQAYEIYQGQMAADQTNYKLPAVYQDILRSKYQTNLSNYRFGFSDRQPAGNATTDCFTTYFNRKSYVDALRKSDSNPNWFWLLHEIAHAEQCSSLGGREFYANRWWNELMAAANATGRSINFNQTPQQLAGQMGTLYASLHDRMPMESAADSKANAVLNQLVTCCISNSDKPIRPLKLGPITMKPDPPGSTIRFLLSVDVENGDSPFKTKWEIVNPGQTFPAPMPDDLDTDQWVLWIPKQDRATAQVEKTTRGTTYKWTYQIRATVSQQDVDLDSATVSRTLTHGESSRIFSPLDNDENKDLELPPHNR